jgi:hypothetical protein
MNSRTKRQTSSKFSLYLEYVIVTDYRIYEFNKQVLNTTNDVVILSYMKIFYSHIIGCVSLFSC